MTTPNAGYVYAATAACLGVLATGWFVARDGLPVADLAYLAASGGVLVGYLLTLRVRPGRPPSTLALVPILALEPRFGSALILAVAWSSLVGGLVRRARPLSLFTNASHDVLAFAMAHLVGASFAATPPLALVAFAVIFTVVRLALWHIALRLGVPLATDSRAEQPELVFSFLLAPLAVLPIIASLPAGDGGLLLTLAALLALLFVVREASNLSVARMEAESERDRLARANELQDEMLHLMTHELKNPLTTVLAYAQLGQSASAEGTSPRITRAFQQVERAGKSIERLVENLLQLSRMAESAELPPAERVDLRELASETIKDLESLAEQKHQTLTIEADTAIGAARVPPILLREAISNLVSNAIKYTPAEGSVRVWARAGDGPETVVLGVTDTGIGLSEEEQARLFDRFFRSADPRARQERGSGLGLALTYAIVHRMGGQILLESTLNQGTTFRLILPSDNGAADLGDGASTT